MSISQKYSFQDRNSRINGLSPIFSTFWLCIHPQFLMKAAKKNLHLLNTLLLYCLLCTAVTAQGPAYLEACAIHPEFDSCLLGSELRILTSSRSIPFPLAQTRLRGGQGLPMEGLGHFERKGKFQRGLYEYWLAFRVENRSGENFTIGIEQSFIKNAWVEVEQRSYLLPKPKAKKQQNIGFNLAANQVYQYTLPTGKSGIFYLLIKDNRLGRDLAPTLWNLDTFRVAQADKLKNLAFGQTIFISLFFTLAIVSTIFYLSRRREVFGWYMAFKWSLALYFLQEIIDQNATQSAQIPWVDWNYTKAGLMVTVFFTYLQFIHSFVKKRVGAEWIESIQGSARLFLLGYFCLDLVLLWFNQLYLSWVLFYVFLWIVVLFSMRAIWFLSKVNYAPTKFILRSAFALIGGFFLSLLAFTFFEEQLSSVKGVELGFLPIGIGGLLESVFFLVSLGEQEKNWLQEHLAFRERETKALERRHIHEHRLQIALEQELAEVKRQLEVQEKAIVNNQELDSKNQRELAYKRLQLRTLRYGFLAKTSDDILQQLNLHLANDQVQAADEQLTRFGGFVRDLLFFAAEPSIAIQTELQLCKRLVQLNDFPIELPELPLPPQWRCPSLLFLSLLYHSAKSLPSTKPGPRLVQEEAESWVKISLQSNSTDFELSQVQPEIWMDAQEQLKNYNLGADFSGTLHESPGGWTVVISKKQP
jgi:7TM diverse intracellular signalling